MIDISTQAPVAQTAESALPSASPSEASGASGFLRLFEIILGGMPEGGQIGSVAMPGTLVPGATDGAAPASVGLEGCAAGVGAEGLQSMLLAVSSQAMPVSSSATSATSATASAGDVLQGFDAEGAKVVADILRQLGFDVEASEVASLGELDRQQLASAMEFLQRGVLAGLPTDDLLENAACLMPREWSFDGGCAEVAPRVEGIAGVSQETSGIDAAQILAGAEAVRQILQPVAGGAVPSSSTVVESTLSEDASVAASDMAAIGGGRDLSASSGGGVRDFEATPVASSPKARETFDVRRGITFRGERGQTGSESASSTDSDGFAAVSDLARPEAKRTDGKALPFQAVQASSSVQSASTGAADAAATAAWASKIVGAAGDANSAQVTQGVRAGSMASEFIGRQVLEKVDVQLRQGRRELNVRLWPEELGEVRLSLRMGEADKLDARILVQTESVRQAILDATPQLREALARHGMEMGRLSVNIDSGSASSSGGNLAGDGRGRGQQDGERQLRRSPWQDEEVEYSAALALGVDSGFRDGRNTLDMWS